MSYPALAIANYFIDKGNVEDDPLDHLRLQKLVYIAHGWNLAVHGEPLIREAVEAWKYGPVIPSLYHQFKRWGNDLITENGVELSGMRARVPNVEYGDERVRQVLDAVWDGYKRFSGVQLSNLTHESGTPWDATWREQRGKGSARIPNDRIEKHFLTRARRSHG